MIFGQITDRFRAVEGLDPCIQVFVWFGQELHSYSSHWPFIRRRFAHAFDTSGKQDALGCARVWEQCRTRGGEMRRSDARARRPRGVAQLVQNRADDCRDASGTDRPTKLKCKMGWDANMGPCMMKAPSKPEGSRDGRSSRSPKKPSVPMSRTSACTPR